MTLWEKFKAIYAPPSEQLIATQEYEQARRSLLEAHSAREYAEAMVMYHQKRIDRLRVTLAKDDK